MDGMFTRQTCRASTYVVVQSSCISNLNMPDGILVPSAIAKELQPNAIIPLETALEQLSKWTSNLPRQSKFYMNLLVTVRDGTALRRSRTKVESLVTADVLFDIHSLPSLDGLGDARIMIPLKMIDRRHTARATESPAAGGSNLGHQCGMFCIHALSWVVICAAKY